MLYPPHILGGAEKSVAMLAEAQAALGHEVAAACTTPGSFSREKRNGISVFRMPHETSFWGEDWPKHSKLERGWRKFIQQYNFRLRDHFANVLDEFRPDIVHTHSLVDVSTTVWDAAASRGLPIVHSLRDYDLLCADASMYHDGRPCGVKCKVMTFAKLPRHRQVDAVVAVGREILQTHLDQGYFTHLPDTARRVIWNTALVEGAGAGYVRPERQSRPFTFGYLGRINEEKGVGTLIDAARLLPPGDWNMIIAGKANNNLAPFQERAAGLPISFPGFMDPKTFFESIDVMVAPSIWAEPLGRTVLESYVMGVPVIGARSGGIPDLIGHEKNDWLFKPGDAQELHQRLANTMALGRASLPTRADFDYVVNETRSATVAGRYLEVYDTALAARRAKAA